MLAVKQTEDAFASNAIVRCGSANGADIRPRLRFLIACLGLLVSGCDNKDRVQAQSTPERAKPIELFLSPAQSEGLQYLSSYDKQVQVKANALGRVKKAMEAVLFDPASAQYSAVRVGRNGAVCGKYNAKNRYGAYVGFKEFVMTSDSRIITNDADSGGSYYYSSYVEACGTQAELSEYRSMMSSLSTTNPTTTEEPSDQEPDQVLDALPQGRKQKSQETPTT